MALVRWEACMSPIPVLLTLVLVLSTLSPAKSKEKIILPADVLNDETVLVVIQPDAGEPLTNPRANRQAQDDVERALMKWGRFRLVMDAQTADLIVAVRKGSGRAVTPTVAGGPIDDRPVILQPSDPGDIRIGGQRGHPTDLSQAQIDGPQNRSPHLGTEVGPAEDILEVYRGRVEYPLDSSPVWRYMAKDGLRSPQVPAVEQFRKVLDEALKAANQGKAKP